MTTAIRRALIFLVFAFCGSREAWSDEKPNGSEPKLVLIKSNRSAARFQIINTSDAPLKLTTDYGVYTEDQPLVAGMVGYEYRMNGEWRIIDNTKGVGYRGTFHLAPKKKKEFDVSLEPFSWVRLRPGTVVRVNVSWRWEHDTDDKETYSEPLLWRPNGTK